MQKQNLTPAAQSLTSMWSAQAQLWKWRLKDTKLCHLATIFLFSQRTRSTRSLSLLWRSPRSRAQRIGNLVMLMEQFRPRTRSSKKMCAPMIHTLEKRMTLVTKLPTSGRWATIISWKRMACSKLCIAQNLKLLPVFRATTITTLAWVLHHWSGNGPSLNNKANSRSLLRSLICRACMFARPFHTRSNASRSCLERTPIASLACHSPCFPFSQISGF